MCADMYHDSFIFDMSRLRRDVPKCSCSLTTGKRRSAVSRYELMTHSTCAWSIHVSIVRDITHLCDIFFVSLLIRM